MQKILTYITVVFAVIFLIKKIVISSRTSKKGGCDNCNC